MKTHPRLVYIMRYPVLQEDEGRHFFVKGPILKAEAEAWVAAQAGRYFSPSDYFLVHKED